MSKSKKDVVKLKRGGVEKSMPKAQWEAMKKTKNTYGWKLASDVSDETLNKEKEIESSKIQELEGKVTELSKENETIKSESAGKDTTIQELEGKVTELQAKVDELSTSDDKKSDEKPKAKPSNKK